MSSSPFPSLARRGKALASAPIHGLCAFTRYDPACVSRFSTCLSRGCRGARAQARHVPLRDRHARQSGCSTQRRLFRQAGMRPSSHAGYVIRRLCVPARNLLPSSASVLIPLQGVRLHTQASITIIIGAIGGSQGGPAIVASAVAPAGPGLARLRSGKVVGTWALCARP